MILSILILAASGWLLFGIIKAAFKIAWCFTKVLACTLCAVSMPLLIIFLITGGGAVLLLPLVLLGIARAAVRV